MNIEAANVFFQTLVPEEQLRQILWFFPDVKDYFTYLLHYLALYLVKRKWDIENQSPKATQEYNVGQFGPVDGQSQLHVGC